MTMTELPANKTLALALAASLSFGIVSFIKYRIAQRQLKIYQNGALAMIGLRIDEEAAHENEDPGLYSFAILSGPSSPGTARAARRVPPPLLRQRTP